MKSTASFRESHTASIGSVRQQLPSLRASPRHQPTASRPRRPEDSDEQLCDVALNLRGIGNGRQSHVQFDSPVRADASTA
jgi:hypothetical protein